MSMLSTITGRGHQRQAPPVREADLRDFTQTAQAQTAPFDAQVQGRAVALYRPPVCLDAQGHTAPGITRDMVARHLAATVARMTEVQLGPVNVQWKEAQGRFVLTSYQVPVFDVTFDVVHPAGVIDQRVADTLDQYLGGICLKVLEMMKGHQQYAGANRQIRGAHSKLEDLRDVAPPVLTTPEYLFLDAALTAALVLSALPHVPQGGGEPVVGMTASVGAVVAPQG